MKKKSRLPGLMGGIRLKAKKGVGEIAVPIRKYGGKPAARVVAYESKRAQFGFVIPRQSVLDIEDLPKSAERISILLFHKSGKPLWEFLRDLGVKKGFVKLGHRSVSREELRKYHLVG